jgi:hypothetical protein
MENNSAEWMIETRKKLKTAVADARGAEIREFDLAVARNRARRVSRASPGSAVPQDARAARPLLPAHIEFLHLSPVEVGDE